MQPNTLAVPESELIGNYATAPKTTVILAGVVFLAIGAVAENWPKVGRPLMVMVLLVLVVEAWRTGL